MNNVNYNSTTDLGKPGEIMFRGQKAIVIEFLPQAWPIDYQFYYGIRHSDEDWDLPCTIESYVLCNRWGWIGFKEPLTMPLRTPDYIRLTEQEQDLLLDRS